MPVETGISVERHHSPILGIGDDLTLLVTHGTRTNICKGVAVKLVQPPTNTYTHNILYHISQYVDEI